MRARATRARGFEGAGASIRWSTLMGIAALLYAGEAKAWYFPEHAELTRLALTDHAPLGVADAIDQVIDEAIDHQGPGIPLCRGATTHFDAIRLKSSRATCITYGALVGLAGDHANTALKLKETLTRTLPRPVFAPDVPLATLVVGAAVEVWKDFEKQATADQLRVWTSQALGRSDLGRSIATTGSSGGRFPSDFVRDLDARLLVIDHGYVDRAKGSKSHFQDSTSSVEEVLRKIEQGDVDNALAQMIIHHERALQLAVAARSLAGQSRYDARVTALFEHAMALHFLEDGFAAGHIATDAAFVVDQQRAQRHDYFNRQGLATTRAIGRYQCSVPAQQVPDRVRGELPICWIAHGDGFVGVEDRLFVTEAVARMQLEFALALSPELRGSLVSACPGWDEPVAAGASLGEEACADSTSHPEGCAPPKVPPSDSCDLWRAGMLLDAFPSWAGIRTDGGKAPSTRAACQAIVNTEMDSLVHMAGPGVPEVTERSADGTQSQPDPADLCLLGDPLNLATADWCAPASRRPSRPVAAGHPGPVAWEVSVWRPILAAWPAAQADVTTLDGTDALGRGWALQVVAGANISTMHPEANGASSVAGAVGAGVGGGISYRLDRVLPERSGRSIAEVNVGVGNALLTGLQDRTFLTIAFAEVRIPVITSLLALSGFLWESDAPLQLITEKGGFGLFGVRCYAQVDSTALTALGWDAEVAFLAPFRPDSDRPASIGSQMDNEFRLRLGVSRVGDREPRASTPLWPLDFHGVPTVAVEFEGGYSWFL